MNRIKPVEKPLEKPSSALRSPAIIETDDHNTGKGDPCHTSKRVQNIGSGRKTLRPSRQAHHPEHSGGSGKGNFQPFFRIPRPCEKKGKYRRQKGPVTEQGQKDQKSDQDVSHRSRRYIFHSAEDPEAQKQGKDHIQSVKFYHSLFGKSKAVWYFGNQREHGKSLSVFLP